jgi:ABC-type nitrate/sulfonate/bicarbonate transport system permease component
LPPPSRLAAAEMKTRNWYRHTARGKRVQKLHRRLWLNGVVAGFGLGFVVASVIAVLFMGVE